MKLTLHLREGGNRIVLNHRPRVGHPIEVFRRAQDQWNRIHPSQCDVSRNVVTLLYGMAEGDLIYVRYSAGGEHFRCQDGRFTMYDKWARPPKAAP